MPQGALEKEVTTSLEITYTMQIALLLGLAATAVILVLSAVVGIEIDDSVETASNGDMAAEKRRYFDNVATAKFHMLFAGFTALFLSLFTCTLLVGFSDHQDTVWRIALGISALVHVNGTYRISKQNLHKRVKSVRPWVMSVVGTAFAIASTVAALGAWHSFFSVIVLLGIMWALIVTSVSFVSLLTIRQHAPH